jgi:hypothetical protein
MTRRVALALLLAGCAAGHGSTESRPPPVESKAPLVTAGPRCTGGSCTCRAVDDFGRPTGEGSTNEGEPAPGKKRFEFRTGRGFDKMTVTVESLGTLTKDTTKIDATCGYVDLPPGRYAVRLRTEAKEVAQGIHPRLLINEHGKKGNDWYSTFSFSCGENSPCIKEDMKQWFEHARTVERGIFDKCGSVRVENIRWSVEHSPEQTLEDLTLDFVLHVYKFEPRFPHGTPTCKGISGGKGAEEEIMQGGAQEQ